MTKVILDTNLYVGWFNDGLHERLMLGPGFVRYLSSVVQMELRVGADDEVGQLMRKRHQVRAVAGRDPQRQTVTRLERARDAVGRGSWRPLRGSARREADDYERDETMQEPVDRHGAPPRSIVRERYRA